MRAGLVALIGDQEIFLSSNPGVPANQSLSATTRLIYRNATSYVLPTGVVPEPGSFVLASVGFIGLGGLVMRRGRPAKGVLTQ